MGSNIIKNPTFKILIPYLSCSHSTVFLIDAYAVLGKAMISPTFQVIDLRRQLIASVAFCTMNKLSVLH